MAGLGRKEWSPGDTLTAADVNGYLMDQSVMVFAGTAARASAIPTPSAGMVAYSTATGLEVYDGSTFTAVTKVLQVVSTAKTDTFTTTSQTYVDITSLSVTITPTSATSKIYVMAVVSAGANTNINQTHLQLARGGTAIFVGDAAGSRTQASMNAFPSAQAAVVSETMLFLDSPATTSATTYNVQIRANAAGTSTVNRSFSDTDNVAAARSASSITVFEVSA
jgi:hypothetical protein